ncbi:MAG: AMP-dependent synthetase, partial [Planctomycetaceae bacterium]|nr:AMP-dependent synthetase [Planctomycetaceae bacterium]
MGCDDSYLLLGPARASTFADSLDEAAGRWSHTALAFPEERATYPELSSRADHLARGLIALGVETNEKVGILLSQGVDYFAFVFAIAKVGAVSVPLNPRFKAKELAHVISNSDMTVLVASDSLLEMPDVLGMLEETLPSLVPADGPELALEEAPLLRRVVMNGETPRDYLVKFSTFLDIAGTVPDEAVLHRRASVAIRDTAIIMYTSGTTANPKGVMLPHEALVRHGFTIAQTRFELTENDRVWSA